MFLGLGSVLHDRRRDIVDPNHVERERRPGACSFLGVDELLEHRRSAAAVLARPGHRGPARVGHPAIPGAKRLERGIVRARPAAGRHHLIGQVRGQPRSQLLAELFHLRRVCEIHVALYRTSRD